MKRDRLRDERNNVCKADFSIQETLDRYFIGGVQHHRIRATRFRRTAGDRNRWVTDLVDRLERQRPQVLDLQAGKVGARPLGVHERVRDGSLISGTDNWALMDPSANSTSA